MDTDIALTVDVGEPDGPPGASTAPTVAGAALVRVAGHLDAPGARRLTAELAATLRERGRVVADVSAVVLVHSVGVHAFVDALERAGGWPAAVLALVAPDPTLAALLISSRVARRVPVRPDVPSALARLDERPELVRAWWHFAVDARAPREARSYVRRVCADWDVGTDVREDAEMVVTELVTNAVEHAASPSVVEVRRVPGCFRMTVRDFDTTQLPEVSLPTPDSARGRGLAMIAAVSESWGGGAPPHADGKTVWSEIAA